MSGFNLSCTPALMLAALALPATAQLTVGPSGSGATFLEISDALNVASVGETILVAAGDYAPIVVIQGVSIVGTGIDLTRINSVNGTLEGAIDITQIPAGQSVRISGLSVGHQSATVDGRIEITQCAGRVELVGIQALYTYPSGLWYSEEPCVSVEDCASVLFDDCTFYGSGPPNAQFWHDASAALEVSNSSVWVNDSFLRGGHGNEGYGGEAIVVTAGSFLHTSRSELYGGGGGTHFGFEWWDIYGNPGEEAIYAEESEVILAGGPGNRTEGAQGAPLSGSDWTGGGAAVKLGINGIVRYSSDSILIRGLDGDGSGADYPVVNDFAAGSVDDPQQVLRPTLNFDPSAVLPGQTVTLETSGNPGASHLTYGSFQGIQPVALGNGIHVHLNPATAFLLPQISLDSAGVGSVQIVVPSNTALIGLELVMQTIDVSPTALRLSGPALLTVIRM